MTPPTPEFFFGIVELAFRLALYAIGLIFVWLIVRSFFGSFKSGKGFAFFIALVLLGVYLYPMDESGEQKWFWLPLVLLGIFGPMVQKKK